jgi:hypothetical protein
MRKDIGTIIVGILFLAAGVAIGGSMLGVFDFTVDLAGWWTIFIIGPAVVSIFSGGLNVGNGVLLFVGTTLLLNAQGMLPGRIQLETHRSADLGPHRCPGYLRDPIRLLRRRPRKATPLPAGLRELGLLRGGTR